MVRRLDRWMDGWNKREEKIRQVTKEKRMNIFNIIDMSLCVYSSGVADVH
jgi:hypothetical protein